LRDALLSLLEKRPFTEITIGDLAAEADVGYSTVCRHFPTLDALLDEVAAEEIGRIINLSFPRFDVTDTRTASMALFRHIDEHRRVWTTLLTGGAAPALRKEFMRLTQALAQAWEQPEPWLPADLGATMTVSGTIELMTWWLRQKDPMSVEEVVEVFQRLLVAPLVADMQPNGRKAVRKPATRSRNQRKR
jgi:AcrR family transcriptional regulator